jgi:nickel-dependent lactate racemase
MAIDTLCSVRLKYGSNEIDVPISKGRWLGECVPQHAGGLDAPDDAIRSSLRSPIGSPALRDIARGGRTAAILISARDRVTGSERFVKLIADELNAARIPDDAIRVYLATGTHLRQTEEDIRGLLGDECRERLAVVHHDPRDAANLVDLGTTSLGTPIAINRGVYESDVKILTGRIAHHYFAGFSGGRKAIAPGVAGFDTILSNHRRVMAGDGSGRNPNAAAGALVNNPVHIDMLEIARAAAPSFCVNTVLNVDHEITHVFAGDYHLAHERGCALVERMFRVRPPSRAEIVVASCGGWPYDISFMQVIKTIVSAADAVADGGVLVVLGQCARGLEAGFLDWFAYASLDDLRQAVLARYNLKGHNSYWIREIQERIRIVLMSDLPPDDVAVLGLVPATDPSAAMRTAYELACADPSILVVPHGNTTVFSEGAASARGR